MFCSECGKQNADDAKFCVGCGTAILTSVQNKIESANKPHLNIQQTDSEVQRINGMSLGESISTCFSKYANFTGRACRSEFWWFYLFYLLISWAGAIVETTPTFNGSGLNILTTLIALALGLPQIAVASRRLHDTGRSGWNQLWMITIIGIIPVVIWLASKSNEHENRYGSVH